MDKTQQAKPVVLTVAQTLELLGGALSRAALYGALQRGEIPHRRIGKRILIPHRRLLEWLEGADVAEAGCNDTAR